MTLPPIHDQLQKPVSTTTELSKLHASRLVLQALLSGKACTAECCQAIQRLSVGWLRQQGLTALVWQRWHSGSLADLTVEIADLRSAYYASVADSELHVRELGCILAALHVEAVTPVLFKGAALAHSVYPDPVCRTMSDLDLWVAVGEIDRAREALITAGYVSRTKLTRPPALMALDNGEVQMHGTRQGTGLVELHFGVFAGEWLRRTTCVDEASIRNRVLPVALLGQRALQLAPEDAVLQLAVHTSVNHQMSLSALRSLVDVTLLARHSLPDWSVIIQRARTWRIATATWLVLSLAVDLCGLDEAAEAVRQLAPSPLRQRLIGLFANAESLVEMRDLSRSKWRYVYLLLLVDRKRDVVKLVYRTLWPEREWLQARYGRADVRTRLRHVFNAGRGRI